jgi:hypothetical protein
MSYKIDGQAVSKPWFVVLTEYRERGGKFRVNSGRRTIAEQWRLYRKYKAGTGNLAAYPAPSAPHINYGRANHAIDVDALAVKAGAPHRMVKWLRKHGVKATRPVRNEPWHIQVDRAGLLRLARRIEADK